MRHRWLKGYNAKLYNLHFHPLEFVGRGQGDEKY